MAQQNKASWLAKRALDLWGDGRLDEAAADFREAIRLSEQGNYNTIDYHGSLGSILSELGHDEDALSEFECALRIAVDTYHDDSSSVVSVSRYFLAEHLLKMHREEDALSCIAPSLPISKRQEAILRAVEAECLWHLDRQSDAKISARRAVATAQSDKQREGITERLEYILVGSNDLYPEIGDVQTPRQIHFELSCLELVVLTAAMFVSIYGPVPPRLVDLSPKERAIVSRLERQCYALRDIAWSRVDAEMLSVREEVIRTRLKSSVTVQIGMREAQLLAHILEVCADEVDDQGDILSVTGFLEYGAGSVDFRKLRQRFIDVALNYESSVTC